MAYITYKYPFKDETGGVTKMARFFGVLAILSFACGIYVIYDTLNTKSENDLAQKGLKDTIRNINSNVISLRKNIDSIGYKIDHKTGLLVPKIVNIKTKVTNVSFEKELTDENANEILRKIMAVRKQDTIINKTILYY